MTTAFTDVFGDFLRRVRERVTHRITKATESIGWIGDISQLLPGKLLRTRLLGRLAGNVRSTRNSMVSEQLCVVTEMIHTASLCHDDVVDNALIRRSGPALWRITSPSGAILIGDVILCDAIDLLVGVADGQYLAPFIVKVKQVLRAEIEQELLFRGSVVDEKICLRMAREKTGPLFAFLARACGGQDQTLCNALEEAGYCVGAAYQLADDLLDVTGKEDRAGKTLGTDARRRKFTLPQSCGEYLTREHVEALCISAVDCLRDYPEQRRGLEQFLALDLQPVLRQHGCGLQVPSRLEV